MPNLDLLAFPNIFPTGQFGKDQSRNVRLSETKFIHQRMRNKDRRFQNSAYLFFLNNHQEMKNVFAAMNFAARKSKNFNQAAFLEAVLNDDAKIDAKVSTLFPQLKGHEAYWKQRRLELDNLCKYE